MYIPTLIMYSVQTGDNFSYTCVGKVFTNWLNRIVFVILKSVLGTCLYMYMHFSICICTTPYSINLTPMSIGCINH